MATLATQDLTGNITRFSGGIGVNDQDIVVQTSDVSRFDEFLLMSTAGALIVFPSLDGTNYPTAPLSLIDMGAAATNPVLASTPNRIYAFYGTFSKVRVLQNGATAATAVCLVCSAKGGQR